MSRLTTPDFAGTLDNPATGGLLHEVENPLARLPGTHEQVLKPERIGITSQPEEVGMQTGKFRPDYPQVLGRSGTSMFMICSMPWQ